MDLGKIVGNFLMTNFKCYYVYLYNRACGGQRPEAALNPVELI